MNPTWTFTNIPGIELKNSLQDGIKTNLSLNFGETFVAKGKTITIYIDGYVLPRENIYSQFEGNNQYTLVKELYIHYGRNFIKNIKGNFNIIVIEDNILRVYCDYIGLRKFFYFEQGNQFIISNTLSEVVKYIGAEVNKHSIVLHSLYQHFVDGNTMFRNIHYSEGATCFEFQSKVNISRYWDISELYSLSRGNNSYFEIAECFRTLIKHYIEFLQPRKISMTITGGRDTRTILAGLLNLGYQPSMFTFGHPHTADVVASKNIAEKCDLHFTNYTYSPNVDWYQNLTAEIVNTGNSLIHIHRAHRLDAIKRVTANDPHIDMVFMGSMGGDYIKGAHLDDYILSEFVRLYWFDKKNLKQIIDYFLKKYFYNNTDSEYLVSLINNQSFNKYSGKDLELNIIHKIIAEMHDYQDQALFGNYVKYCITPFMDIDFLYDLFSSKFSLYDNYQVSTNPFKKLKGGELQCNIIRELFRPLAFVNFAYPYTPNDLLENRVRYLLKRIYIKLKNQPQVPGFSYNKWFVDYINDQFSNVQSEIIDIFNIEDIKKDLEKNSHQTTEGYWHRYSNIVMLSNYLNYFKGEL